MSDRKRFLLLILIMSAVTLIMGVVALTVLYRAAIEEGRLRLRETAQGRARLIEAVARYDRRDHLEQLPPEEAEAAAAEATLGQIRDAHARFEGFGRTGEFTLARERDDQIEFLLSHRWQDLTDPRPVPLDSDLAEPMRRALRGESGTLIGNDYRGARVLAAYEPVDVLDLGVVAKIDLNEVRAPFFRAGAIAGVVGLILIMLGAGMFVRIGSPIIRRLEENERRLREELRERQRVEKEREEILRSSNDLICIAGDDGYLKYVNPAWERTLGYTSEELLSRPFLEIAHPDDRSRGVAELDRLRAGQPTSDFEIRLAGRDGTPHHISWMAMPRKDAGLFYCIGRDITERTRSLESLRKSEEQYRLMFENAGVLVSAYDREGRCILMNRLVADAFGGEPEQFIGRTYADLHAWAPAEFEKRVIGAIDSREVHTQEDPVYFPTGLRWLVTTIFPLKDAAGTPYASQIVSQDVTELREAEGALRKAAAINEAIVNSSPLGIAIYDPAGDCVSVNDSIAEMVGAAREQLLQQNMHHIESWRKSGFYAAATQAIDRRERRHLVQEVTTTFGRSVVLDVYFVPVPVEGQTYLLVMMDDVTERRHAETELRRSEFLLTEMGTIARIGGWEHDLRTGEARWTRSTYEITEIEPGEPIPGSAEHLDYYEPEDRATLEQAINRTIETGEPFDLELRCNTAKGRPFWARAIGHPVYEEGKCVKLRGTFQDITDQKRARDALEESERKFRALFERSSDAHVIFDGQKFIDCNQACLDMLGMTDPSDLLGRHPSEISPEKQDDGRDSREKAQEMIARTFEKGGHRFEWTSLRTDGETVLLDILVNAITIDGRPAIHAVWRDITARRAAEAELTRYRHHLEELVRERTRELEQAHEKLLQQERLATLGQLTATVAHELRNPLGTIRTALFSVNELVSGEQPGVRDAMTRAERNIDRCDRIIEELLDYARSKRLVRQRTAIDAWLTEVLEEQKMSGNVRLERNLACGLELAVDRERLRRCVVNLVTNSLQAMQENDPSGGLLRVETRVANQRLEIVITDTGPGIKPDDMVRVTEPLYSTKGFGVGLGLPIVRQIMELHAGGLEINSELGKGTSVIAWLPLD